MILSWPGSARFRTADYLLLSLAVVSASAASADKPAALVGAAAEEFLRTAEVIDTEEVGEGVTFPKRITLTDGKRTARALWKTIDEYAPVKDFHDGRPPEIGFRDSWKHEIAAYKLDQLLGFGLVPPAVARKVRGVEGAAQLWIENSITETERRQRGIKVDDPTAWNRQIHSVRLFRQLTYDTDFNNTGNLLIGEDFRVWAIDYSRAFRTRKKLLAKGDLERFPAGPLERLRQLGRTELLAATSGWLTEGQCAALLARRDLIIRRADRLLAEHGEAAVLLD